MGPKMRILLVEDSLRLQELLAEGLRGAGFGVDAVTTVAELLSATKTVSYDLLIVDLMLPDGDGADAVRTLRAGHCSVPILIITAKGSTEDRIAGLDAGADDYLIKPFNHRELLARVRVLLRRPPGLTGPVLRLGDVELDEAGAMVRCSGKVVDLRLSERRLLALLMRRDGSVVSKRMIENALSTCGDELSDNAIETQVSRLRKGLEEVNSGIFIETVRGVGYVLRSLAEPPTRS
jgi:two-component system OmpR family response regulator